MHLLVIVFTIILRCVFVLLWYYERIEIGNENDQVS